MCIGSIVPVDKVQNGRASDGLARAAAITSDTDRKERIALRVKPPLAALGQGKPAEYVGHVGPSSHRGAYIFVHGCACRISSDERGGGQEGDSRLRSGWSPGCQKKKKSK